MFTGFNFGIHGIGHETDTTDINYLLLRWIDPALSSFPVEHSRLVTGFNAGIHGIGHTT